MSYEKKVLVLKQVAGDYCFAGKDVSGIARLECENGVCDFYLSLINLKSVYNGSYHVYLLDRNERLYHFDVGKRPTSIIKKLLPCPNVNDGFAISLCHVNDHLPYQVAGGVTPNFSFTLAKLNGMIAEKCLADFKSEQREKELQLKNDDLKTQEANLYTQTEQYKHPAYDDEAVATENYFDTDERIKNKLNAVKEWDFENCGNEDELFNSSSKKEATQKQGCGYRVEDETGFCTSGEFTQEAPYYLTAKDELQKLFDKFPAEDCLNGIFPDSRWVKIYYAQNKYYLVGLIKENLVEKYICYGVPAKYSATPPPQLDGYCTFIPLSIYDMHGDGFWMIFQDAVTGKCVIPDQN